MRRCERGASVYDGSPFGRLCAPATKSLMVLGLFLMIGLAAPNRGRAQFVATAPSGEAVGLLFLGPPILAILATHVLTAVNLGQVLGSRTYFDEVGAIGELVFSSVGMLALIGPAWALGRAPQNTPDWVWAITASTAMSVTWNFTHAILSLVMPGARPLPVEVGISPGGFQLRGRF